MSPICHRVTYWRYTEPATSEAVRAGFDRSSTFVVTVRVCPDRLSVFPRTSMPGTSVPPITGYRASPHGSESPLTGALEVPVTDEPSRPGPADCRAIVITPAPA